MKAISLLQPWASLVVLGHKKIETRSWNTNYRGALLIQASLGYQGLSLIESAYNHDLAINARSVGVKHDYDYPRGFIIGQVELVNVVKMDDIIMYNSCTTKGITWELNNIELSFGDFSEGRYAWLLSNPICFKQPIKARGTQGLWNFDLPATS